MPGTSFDSTKIYLQDLLDRAGKGSLQLPDFQRGWVWDDERIKGLQNSPTAVTENVFVYWVIGQ